MTDTTTWVHEGLARLEAAVAEAAEAEAVAHRTYASAPRDGMTTALIDYVRASTRRNTLNEAGLIFTLGTGEEPDDEDA